MVMKAVSIKSGRKTIVILSRLPVWWEHKDLKASKLVRGRTRVDIENNIFVGSGQNRGRVRRLDGDE